MSKPEWRGTGSIYCTQCNQPTFVMYGTLCAACDVERLKERIAELEADVRTWQTTATYLGELRDKVLKERDTHGARIAELEAALAPFAELSKMLTQYKPTVKIADYYATFATVTVDHIRRAAKAMGVKS